MNKIRRGFRRALLAAGWVAAAMVAGLLIYRLEITRCVARDEQALVLNPVSRLRYGAEAYSHRGNRTGVLLVHGYGSSAREMRYLGEYLAGRGYSVEVIALPGHGAGARALENTVWADYYRATVNGYQGLRRRCGKVVVVGLSMGGTLCLRLAAENPDVDGVVAVNSFLRVKYAPGNVLPPEFWARLIGPLLRYTGKSAVPSINDPAGRRGHIRTRYHAMRSLLTVLDGVRETAAILPMIKQPILILQSRCDDTVMPDGPLIWRAVASPNKRIIYFEKSNHILTLDYEKEQACACVAAFIASL